MNVKTFTLSATEAAYTVAALVIALETLTLAEHDRTVMEAILDKLAAPMPLSDEVLTRLKRARRQQ